jgi:hypothetical protein
MECPSMMAIHLALMEGVSDEEIQYGQLLTLAIALPFGIVLGLLLSLV